MPLGAILDYTNYCKYKGTLIFIFFTFLFFKVEKWQWHLGWKAEPLSASSLSPFPLSHQRQSREKAGWLQGQVKGSYETQRRDAGKKWDLPPREERCLWENGKQSAKKKLLETEMEKKTWKGQPACETRTHLFTNSNDLITVTRNQPPSNVATLQFL